MVDILYERFEPDIANNIRKFLQTPEAAMIKAYWTLVRKCYRFDNGTRWYEWKRIDHVFKKNGMRYYRIFERSIMFRGIVKRDDNWCIWQLWSVEGNNAMHYKKIPHSLQGIFKSDECGYHWIKFELEDYEGEDRGHFDFDELENIYDADDIEDSEEISE